MSKIKKILLKIDFEGRGIVNYDSAEQKSMLYDSNLRNRFWSKYSNVSFAKKSFFYNEKGDLDYKIKVSKDCLRKNIFGEDIIAQSPSIIHSDISLYQYIASPMSILRGYMFADTDETIKRSGPFTITDAIQTCNAVSNIDFNSTSAYKEKKEENDVSGNTVFKKETIGDIKYSAFGNIDLQEMSFVSCDNLYNRYGFNSDKFDLYYKGFMKMRIPNFNSELGYYNISSDTNVSDLPEYGFKFSNDNVNFLTKECLTKIKSLKINLNGGTLWTASLKIKLVESNTFDTYNTKDGWLEINTQEDIDNLYFDTDEFYTEVDLTTAKNTRLDYEKKFKEAQQKSKQKKSDNAKATADKKAKAIAAKKEREQSN